MAAHIKREEENQMDGPGVIVEEGISTDKQHQLDESVVISEEDMKTDEPLNETDNAVKISEEQEMIEAFCIGIVEELVEKVAEDNLDTCSICYGEVWRNQEHASLPCGHIFHKACIGTWLKRVRTTTCPTCRGEVPRRVRAALRKRKL